MIRRQMPTKLVMVLKKAVPHQDFSNSTLDSAERVPRNYFGNFPDILE